jgi:hypothetical protein
MAEWRAHANVKCFHERDAGNSEMLFELENAMRCDALKLHVRVHVPSTFVPTWSIKHGMTLDGVSRLLPSSRVACLGVAAFDDDAPVHGNKPLKILCRKEAS